MKKILLILFALCGVASAQPVSSGGLLKVVHGSELTGNGTNSSPIGLTPCGTAGQGWVWNGTVWNCASGGGGVTNSAGNNVVPKSNGTNLVASDIGDDGTSVTIGASKVTFTVANGNTAIVGTLTADSGARVFDAVGSGITAVANTISADTSVVQARVSSTCTSPQSILSISSTGTVTCTTASATTSAGTTNTIAKYSSGSNIANSGLVDNATTISTAAENVAVTHTGTQTSALSGSYTGTAQTVTHNALAATNSGTYNTTAGVLSAFGANVSITSTRSSGANNLTNIGVQIAASGAQVNQALVTTTGDVILNQTSGTFTGHGAAQFDSTVNSTGALTEATNRVFSQPGTNLTRDGTNANQINCANFASGTGGCVPASGGGTSNFLRADGTWSAPAGGGNVTTGTLTSGTIPKASGGTSIVNSSILDNGTTVSTTEQITGNAGLHLDTSTSDGVAPEQDWIARNGDWEIGVDVANTTPARDFVLAGLRGTYAFEDGVCNGTTTVTSAAQGGFSSAIVGKGIAGTNIAGGTTVSAVASATSMTLSNTCTTGTSLRFVVTNSTTTDVAYWKHRGSLSPTLGLGITPPDGSARLQIGGSDTEATLGEVSLRISSGQTANVLSVVDTGGTPRTWIDSQGVFGGNNASWGGGFVVAGDSTNNRAVSMLDNTKSYSYGFTMPGSSESRFRYISGGVDVWKADSSGGLTALNSFTGTGAAIFQNSVTLNNTTGTTTIGGAATLNSTLLTTGAATFQDNVILNNTTGTTTIGGAATFNNSLTSTSGPNTFGEMEYSFTTRSDTSGTLTDVSFSRVRGIWWTATGTMTVDGFGFTSGVPADGQRFMICALGGGTVLLQHENSSETTAGRRLNLPNNTSVIVRSQACRDFIYDATAARWRTEGVISTAATLSANVIPRMSNGTELAASSLSDTGAAVTGTAPVTFSGGGNATVLTLTKSNTAQTTDGNGLTINNTSSWNTTAAVHTTYGINATCTNTISSGANTLSTVCGYFSNTSSGANITAYGLYEDNGDVRLNATTGQAVVKGPFTVDNNNSSAATTSAQFNYSRTAQTSGGTATFAQNTGTFDTTAGALTSYALKASNTSSRSAGANNLTNFGFDTTATGAQVNVALQTDDGDVKLTNTSGNVYMGGSAPTLSACGTSPSITGHNNAGIITIGTAPSTTCTVTFANSGFSSTPACTISPEYNPASSAQHIWFSAKSATAFTVSENSTSFTAGQKLDYVCVGI